MSASFRCRCTRRAAIPPPKNSRRSRPSARQTKERVAGGAVTASGSTRRVLGLGRPFGIVKNRTFFPKPPGMDLRRSRKDFPTQTPEPLMSCPRISPDRTCQTPLLHLPRSWATSAMYRHEIQFPPKDAALRDDVHDLGALVGEILKEQGGTRLFDLVEGDRVAAIRRREGDPAGDSALRARVLDREPSAAKELVRAFSTWFQVVNLAEQVHRIRRRRQYFLDSAHPQPDGVEDALHSLKAQGLKLEEVLALLAGTRIEPIFTAHPTESPRRTL